MSNDLDKLVEKYDYQTKLDIAAWVISKIDDHGNDPGSFRGLIYGRLNFGLDAYVPLYEAGGMNITNELDYRFKEELRKIVSDHKIDNVSLKKMIGVCDEPGCYDDASCGTPTNEGYRWTCYQHAPKEQSNMEAHI